MAIVFPEILPQVSRLPFYVTGAGVDHVQEDIDRPSGYHDWQWIQVLRGQGELHVGNAHWTLSADSGFLLLPGDAHSYRRTGDELVVDWICFQGSGVASLLQAGPIQRSGSYGILYPPLVGRFLRSCFDASISGGMLQAYEASGALYQMLLALLAGAHEPGKEAPETGYLRLRPVLSWMEEHMDKPVGVDDMARVILVSPAHLCRLFRKHLGTSPLDYLIHLRMDKARNMLLSHPELRVKEIAALVGYQDENYFARMFRARFGMAARDFRKLHGY